MPKIFCRTPELHCSFAFSEKFRKFRFQCRFLRQRFRHMLTVHLARSSPPLPPVWSTTRALGLFLASVACWPALAGVFCGVGTSRGSRQGTERRLNAVRCRPTPLCSPRGLMHASARPWHRRRGPASTEHAHCRRRARAVPFCRTRP